jgi:hypothetical protein
MHMWHHVTNHLIISNDKDSNSENRINYASVTSSMSEKMLENNGHYLQAKIVSEQRAAEITKLQEALTSHVKENNDLKVEVKSLK